jgi:predicted  nucleic acid-binding Zn-ribbon protein
MSTTRTRAAAPEPPGPAASSLVQQLLAERRDLLVARERLRLELDELRTRQGRPDPRLKRLEDENARLRADLASARTELEAMEAGVQHAVSQLESASGR